jgi:ornithine cyclodeaminase/alanine dehydrogenase-like protein (mu-crystallin family)
MPAVRTVSSRTLRRLVSTDDAIATQRTAFRDFARKRVEAPMRTRLELSHGSAVVMPAYGYTRGGRLSVKVVLTLPRNRAKGLPTVSGIFALLDAKTGQLLSLMDASWITAVRTGATAAVAADALAAKDASALALLGAGAVGEQALRATARVRQLRQVRIWSRHRAAAHDLARRARRFPSLHGAEVVPVSTPAAAVNGAQLIVTATASHEPLVPGGVFPFGSHVSAMGGDSPRRELDGETLARARIVVDSRDVAWKESGELIIAEQQGYIDRKTEIEELGQVLLGDSPSRPDAEISVFKSNGIAFQDLALASLAYDRLSAE